MRGLERVWQDGTWMVWRVEGSAVADPPVRVLDTDRTRVRFSGPGVAVVGSALRLRPPGHC